MQKALEHFERSGKVHPSVLQASIFRKPYFVGRFLPTLLTPTPVSSGIALFIVSVCPIHSHQRLRTRLFSKGRANYGLPSCVPGCVHLLCSFLLSLTTAWRKNQGPVHPGTCKVTPSSLNCPFLRHTLCHLLTVPLLQREEGASKATHSL